MVFRPLWHQQPCFPQRVQGSGDKRRNRFSQTQENIGTSRTLFLYVTSFFSNVRRDNNTQKMATTHTRVAIPLALISTLLPWKSETKS